jgi:tRNA-2-methylthio-N6-dimethylallyladenosine synthase
VLITSLLRIHISPIVYNVSMTVSEQRGRYTILTWGCQMNEDDSSQMASLMEADGYELSDVDDADVILLNTCSVRAKPEHKVYSRLGELRELKLLKPDMIIGVCGCMAQKEAGRILQKAPHVDLVVGTGQIDKVPALVNRVRQERKSLVSTELPDRKRNSDKSTPLRAHEFTLPKLKSFVSIMYGCDKFCTFCIVPITRGKERSRPADEIVLEVERLASRGTKEVTLLGQTVNSYGKFLDEPCSFAKLLSRLNDIEGIERIRFTSPYPKDFSDDVIEAIGSLPKVCPQVHLPIQVADDLLLSRMHRGYTLDQYRTVVEKLRNAVPDLALTTDIMLGFPGETDEQFENTMSFMRETRYDSAYMFAYSPREGTKAAVMDRQVPHNLKIDRLQALIELQNQITLEINRNQCGKTYEVLVEGKSSKNTGKWVGLTPQGKTVHFEAGRELQGEVIRVTADEAHLWGFIGSVPTATSTRGIPLQMAFAG